MATTRNRLAGKRVTINVHKGTKPEHISNVMGELYKLSGCLPCGILGWDIILRGGDPEVAALGGVKQLGGVTVEAQAG